MENKKIGNISFMRFGREEIGTPKIEEYYGKNEWIEWGRKNDFPQEIIRLYQNSSGLFKRLVDRQSDMIAGNGFIDIPELKDLLDNKFSKKKLGRIAHSAARDFVLFGGYALKVIFNKEGKIAQVENQPLEKLRIEKPNEDGEIMGYYISSDWLKWRRDENTPYFIKDFDPKKFKEHPEQIIFIKQDCPGMDWYPLPSYFPVFNYIKLDYEISTFHLKNVQNGLMPGMVIVNKQGIPTPEQREEEYQELKERYGGADNTGDFILVYAESPDKAPDFIPIELNGTDKRFGELMKTIDEKIKVAMGFTSALAGIEVSGKLGSKNEITEQLEYMQLTLIRPLQLYLEEGFNLIAKTNGLPEAFELVEYKMFRDEVSSFLDNLNSQNNIIIQKVLDSIPVEELKVMLGYNEDKNKM